MEDYDSKQADSFKLNTTPKVNTTPKYSEVSYHIDELPSKNHNFISIQAKTQLFINGQFIDSKATKYIKVLNPVKIKSEISCNFT